MLERSEEQHSIKVQETLQLLEDIGVPKYSKLAIYPIRFLYQLHGRSTSQLIDKYRATIAFEAYHWFLVPSHINFLFSQLCNPEKIGDNILVTLVFQFNIYMILAQRYHRLRLRLLIDKRRARDEKAKKNYHRTLHV